MHGTNNCPKCGRDLCVCNRKPSDRPERVAERVRLHRRLAVFKRIGDTYNALPPEIRTSVIDHMIASGIADVDLVRNEFELCRMLAERWGISRPGLLRCGPHQLALGAYDADQERIDAKPCGASPGIPEGGRKGFGQAHGRGSHGRRLFSRRPRSRRRLRAQFITNYGSSKNSSCALASAALSG